MLLPVLLSALLSRAAVDEPSWIELPAPRHGHRAHLIGSSITVLGGEVRSVGGAADGRRSTAFFDLPTKGWRAGPLMSEGKSFFGSAVVGRSIYAIGRKIERLAPGAQKWETVFQDPNLPSSHFAVAALGNRIFIIGREIDVFDTRTCKVERIAGYPGMKPDDHFEIAAGIGNELHVIGGLDGDSFQPRAVHYVWKDSQWKRLPDAPSSLFAKFSVVETIGPRLYIFSSRGSLCYDSSSRKWSRLTDMPQDLAMPAAVTYDGWIHVLGGLPVDGKRMLHAYHVRDNRWVSKLASEASGP